MMNVNVNVPQNAAPLRGGMVGGGEKPSETAGASVSVLKGVSLSVTSIGDFQALLERLQLETTDKRDEVNQGMVRGAIDAILACVDLQNERQEAVIRAIGEAADELAELQKDQRADLKQKESLEAEKRGVDAALAVEIERLEALLAAETVTPEERAKAEQAKDKAAERIEGENEKTREEQIAECRANIAAYNARLSALDGQIAAVDGRMKADSARIGELKTKCAELSDELTAQSGMVLAMALRSAARTDPEGMREMLEAFEEIFEKASAAASESATAFLAFLGGEDLLEVVKENMTEMV